jgi:hypothetical protein
MIDPPAQANYLAMGRWLKKNGESIYGTTGGPYKPGPYGVCTRKGRRIYLHILAKFADNKKSILLLPKFPSEISKVYTMDGQTVSLDENRQGSCYAIDLSKVKLNPVDNIVVIELKKNNAEQIIPIEPARRIAVKSASASSSYGKDLTPDALISGGDGKFEAGIHRHKSWVAKGNPQREQWLEIGLEKAQKVSALAIAEPRGRHLITDFIIEYDDNGSWCELYRGKTIESDFSLIFAPVTTAKFRLRILSHKHGDPGIQRFTPYITDCHEPKRH